MSEVKENSNTEFQITDKAEFEKLFNAHYSNLCAYAHNFLKDVDDSEEVVQEVLFKMWQKKDELEINSSLQSYLFRAVRNSCLNIIRHVEVREEFKAHNQREININEALYEEEITASDLEQKIRETIDLLPIERRKVFVMSRYDGLKYREIAEELGISIKTVEAQVGKALKFMREELAEYMPLFILFFYKFFN